MDTLSLQFCVLLLVLCVYEARSQTVSPGRAGARSRDLTIRSRMPTSVAAMPARGPRAQIDPRVMASRSPVPRTRGSVNLRQGSIQAPRRPTMIRTMAAMPGRSRDIRRPVSSIRTRGRPQGLSPRGPRGQRDQRFRGAPRVVRPRFGPSGPVVQRPRLRLIPVNRQTCSRQLTPLCREIPRMQNVRGRTTFCYRNCPGRPCVVRCMCACVSGSRLRSMLNPRPPSRPAGRSGIRLQNTLQVRRPGQREMFQRPSNRSRTRDLTFGISDTALAAILANPDVSSLVGPQGINDILAGEPPPIISREARRRMGSRTRDLLPRISQTGQQIQPSPMGIPIPLPGTRQEPPLDSSLMLAGLLAGSSDLPEIMPELKMRSNVIPAKRGSPAPPDISLMMPSATIDNSGRIQSAFGANLNRTRMPISGSGMSAIGPRFNVPIANRSIPGIAQNQTLPALREFLTGAVKTPSPQMTSPSKQECLARRQELWCDPVGVWSETPGVARWCILNCRAEKCDLKRCSCSCIDELQFKRKYEQMRLRAP